MGAAAFRRLRGAMAQGKKGNTSPGPDWSWCFSCAHVRYHCRPRPEFISQDRSNMLSSHHAADYSRLARTSIDPGVSAHPGGLNAKGCHNNRKTGDYHCHRQRRATRPASGNSVDGSVYFPNCTTARAAGFGNIRRGQPGYRPELDRDDDGIACESN